MEGAFPWMQMDLLCSDTGELPEAASKTWSK